ncbi:hypothetical protein HPP92_002308 [Vanilla planifolia]|uniref:HTH OST-type domain-containing protein n=1 Tax=Vanilla planifolia TaxID=51239 RepID=A0A835S1J2_VANPL|nr:hypothetical protein HPP92_002308 [Vanilla planifolia]
MVGLRELRHSGGVNVHRVANRITWAVRSCGIKGPVTITAFGDVAQLSRAAQEALTSTGICLTHVPHCGKNSSDRSLMADIVYWVSQNPPPVHFFLISGDKDFANILHRLRMSNYNVLLACTDTASGVLCSAATLMWPWNGLVKGENINVRHFNYPPDGLYGSWYVYHRGALDDPFADSDMLSTTQPEESMEPISECKPRPVPKVVKNGIRQVLSLHPEGISLSELRLELKRNNIGLDKDFFGHKKFSKFIAALSISKFIPPPTDDRQPLVVIADKKVVEQPEVIPRSGKGIDNNGLCVEKGSNQNEHAKVDLTSDHSCNDLDANGTGALFKEGHTVVNLEVNKGVSGLQNTTSDHSNVSQKSDSMVVEDSLIKKIWRALTGSKVGFSLSKVDNSLEVNYFKNEATGKSFKITQLKKDDAENRKVHFPDNQKTDTSILHPDKSITKDNAIGSSNMYNFEHEQNVGLIERMVKWCKSMIYGIDQDKCHVPIESENETASKADITMPFPNTHSSAHELFSKTDFWDELESFLLTSHGSKLILNSQTRVQLVKRLKVEGPESLKELDRKHLLNLVDILVSEKKWLEECASQMFPFKLTMPSKKNSCPSQPSSHFNGLSSLFSYRFPPSNSQKTSEQQKTQQNPISVGLPETGTTPPTNLGELRLWFKSNFVGRGDVEPDEFQKLYEDKFNIKLCSSSYGYHSVGSLLAACSTGVANAMGRGNGPSCRESILTDCQKLVKELMEKNPTVFNMSIFRDEFVKKYGYVLDYQALGYPRLMSLLQIIPGIRVDSSFIRPLGENLPAMYLNLEEDKSKNVLLEKVKTDDSLWEELGPLSQMDKEVTFSPVSLSEDEYTDSEEDAHPLPERLGNNKEGAEDGSLLLKFLIHGMVKRNSIKMLMA